MPDLRTPSELFYELSRSSYHLVVVEGKADVKVYRALAIHLEKPHLKFEYCQGRNTLLEVFKMSMKVPQKHLMFLADKDMWVFTGVPQEYNEVFFTNGYSIENDLFTDGENWIEGLFSKEEQQYKASILESLITWFAFEVEKYLQSPDKETNFTEVSLYQTGTMPKKEANFTPEFLARRGFGTPTQETIDTIKQHYQVKIRGKYLFQLLGKLFLERKAENKDAITFTEEQLWEICLNEGKRKEEGMIQRIMKQLEVFLGETT